MRINTIYCIPVWQPVMCRPPWVTILTSQRILLHSALTLKLHIIQTVQECVHQKQGTLHAARQGRSFIEQPTSTQVSLLPINSTAATTEICDGALNIRSRMYKSQQYYHPFAHTPSRVILVINLTKGEAMMMICSVELPACVYALQRRMYGQTNSCTAQSYVLSAPTLSRLS